MSLFKKKKHRKLEVINTVEQKKVNVKVLIPIVVVIVIILAMVVKAKMGNKVTYDSITPTIMNMNQVGQFDYTFKVKTSDVNAKENATDAKSAKIEVSEDTDNKGDETATPAPTGNQVVDDLGGEVVSEKKTLSAKTEEWNTDEVKQDNKYLDYTIKMSTNVESIKPYMMNMDIKVQIGDYSGKLTSIVQTKDTTYIDVYQMKQFLSESGVLALQNIAEGIPNGSEYVAIPAKEFKYYLDCVEDGERDLTGMNLSETMLFYGSYIATILTSADKDLVGTITSGKIYETALKNSGHDFTNKKISTYLSNAVVNYNNSQAGLKALYSTNEVQNIKNYKESEDMSEYKSEKGNPVKESKSDVSFDIRQTHYSFSTFIMVKQNEMEKVEEPDSSTDLKTYFGDDKYVFQEQFEKCLNYFNPFKGYTTVGYQSQLEPSDLTDKTLTDFAKIINDLGVCDYNITKDNVLDYVKKYKDGNQEEDANAKVINDYLVAMYNTTEGLAHKEETKNSDVEQYPKTTKEVDGVKFTTSVDVKFSAENSSITVIKVDMKNVSKNTKTVDLTKFNEQDLIPNKYPANNLTMLRNIDGNFDMNKLEDTITLEAGKSHSSTLYVVSESTNGYRDIWYGEDKLGVLVAY